MSDDGEAEKKLAATSDADDGTKSNITLAPMAKKPKMEGQQQPPQTNQDSKTAAQTIRINAKCSDCCFTQALDADGNVLAEKDGYVPDFMPGQHFGDYIELSIDVQSGKLLNWGTPPPESTKILNDLASEEE